MITDHRYESRFGRPGCGVLAGNLRCSEPEEEHALKAHQPDRDAASLNMHEPKPYTGELDWHNADTTVEDSVG